MIRGGRRARGDPQAYGYPTPDRAALATKADAVTRRLVARHGHARFSSRDPLSMLVWDCPVNADSVTLRGRIMQQQQLPRLMGDGRPVAERRVATLAVVGLPPLHGHQKIRSVRRR
jgi:hypothetical protein